MVCCVVVAHQVKSIVPLQLTYFLAMGPNPGHLQFKILSWQVMGKALLGLWCQGADRRQPLISCLDERKEFVGFTATATGCGGDGQCPRWLEQEIGQFMGEQASGVSGY